MNLQTATDLINLDRALTVREATELTDWLHLEGGDKLLPYATRHRAAPRLAYWSTDLAMAAIAWDGLTTAGRYRLCKFASVPEQNCGYSFEEVPVIQRFQIADQMGAWRTQCRAALAAQTNRVVV